MHCGQALAPQAPAPAPRPQAPTQVRAPTGNPVKPAPAAQGAGAAAGIISPAAFQATAEANRKKALVIGGVVLLMVAIGAIGIKASGILESGKGPVAAGDLRAKGLGSDSLIKARGMDSGSMINKGAALIGMPDDVRDWLEHLRQVEEKKRELTAEQMHEEVLLMGQIQNTEGLMSGKEVQQMADPDNNATEVPAVTAMKQFGEKYKPKWYALSQFLESKPAPAECKTIESAYDQGLNQMGMVIGDFSGILDSVGEKANDDPEGAKQEGKKAVDSIGTDHVKYIDQSFTSADNGVQAICDKYKVKKPFDIDSSGKSSSPFISKG